MDLDIGAWRRSQRMALLALRQKVDAAMFRRWSDAITARLAVRAAALAPEILGFYWAHRGEYDPMPIALQHLLRGGQAALPAVVGRGLPLAYRPWQPAAAMAAGKYSFGIPEPADGPAVAPDLMLIPLLGFDGDGYRLGYGGGYFDRTLAACPTRPKTIGVGLELGRLRTIHPQPHDIPLDRIVTELGDFSTG